MSRSVLVVDDEENIRHMLSVCLTKEGYIVEAAPDGLTALARLREGRFDVVLCDVRMPRLGGLELLNEISKEKIRTVMVMMSAYGSHDQAIEAIKKGAYDYLRKPFKMDEVLLLLKKIEEREKLLRENTQLRSQVRREFQIENIVAQSDKMVDILKMVEKIAEYKTTVLLLGENGTGKDVLARAIHHQSSRAKAPFVAINCGAIPENLLESELFGHRKGAFTDASRDKKGLFEEANGGTILLDEIGELPLMLQVKLLRVLQEEEIRSVGANQPAKVDVRIIAATNKDLAREVAEGRFREDLYYRLNVLPIKIPPLRERPEDIPALVDHFIEKFNAKHGRQIEGVDAEAMKLLMAHRWSGNVRELENAIERAVVLTKEKQIEPSNLDNLVPAMSGQRPVGGIFLDGEELSVKKQTARLEVILIRKALDKTQGNRTKAAKLLEISHRALLYKIRDYGLSEYGE